MELSSPFFVRSCNFINAAVDEFSVAASVVTQHRCWTSVSGMDYGDSVARKSVAPRIQAGRGV